MRLTELESNKEKLRLHYEKEIETLLKSNRSLQESNDICNAKCNDLLSQNTTLQHQICKLEAVTKDRDQSIQMLSMQLSKIEHEVKVTVSSNESMQHVVRSTNNICDRVTCLLEKHLDSTIPHQTSVANVNRDKPIPVPVSTGYSSNPFLSSAADNNITDDTRRSQGTKPLVYVLGSSQCKGVEPDRLFRDKYVIGIQDPPYSIDSAKQRIEQIKRLSPEITIIHLISNDIKLHTSDKVANDMISMIDTIVAGREMPQIHGNWALGDKFLQFCMMLHMGIRYSKTTANKVG